ncbi:MAG: hypothetical protein FJ161_03385 [Gammaproteobacteria bacterium]|nr:hypothetical protein [Gammaproteobacteria bacterium]
MNNAEQDNTQTLAQYLDNNFEDVRPDRSVDKYTNQTLITEDDIMQPAFNKLLQHESNIKNGKKLNIATAFQGDPDLIFINWIVNAKRDRLMDQLYVAYSKIPFYIRIFSPLKTFFPESFKEVISLESQIKRMDVLRNQRSEAPLLKSIVPKPDPDEYPVSAIDFLRKQPLKKAYEEYIYKPEDSNHKLKRAEILKLVAQKNGVTEAPHHDASSLSQNAANTTHEEVKAKKKKTVSWGSDVKGGG